MDGVRDYVCIRKTEETSKGNTEENRGILRVAEGREQNIRCRKGGRAVEGGYGYVLRNRIRRSHGASGPGP